jgi:large subunit ribosomal protein L18
MDKKQSRLRRARQTRHKIDELRVNRLTVYRSNAHIYAHVVAAGGDRVLVSASTNEAEVRMQLAGQSGKGGNTAAAAIVGQRVAQRALAAGPTREEYPGWQRFRQGSARNSATTD